jgi:hypothetical protein
LLTYAAYTIGKPTVGVWPVEPNLSVVRAGPAGHGARGGAVHCVQRVAGGVRELCHQSEAAPPSGSLQQTRHTSTVHHYIQVQELIMLTCSGMYQSCLPIRMCFMRIRIRLRTERWLQFRIQIQKYQFYLPVTVAIYQNMKGIVICNTVNFCYIKAQLFFKLYLYQCCYIFCFWILIRT